jgi:hypothetical protein
MLYALASTGVSQAYQASRMQERWRSRASEASRARGPGPRDPFAVISHKIRLVGYKRDGATLQPLEPPSALLKREAPGPPPRRKYCTAETVP